MESTIGPGNKLCMVEETVSILQGVCLDGLAFSEEPCFISDLAAALTYLSLSVAEQHPLDLPLE